jgi:hypothetical protein
MSDRDDKYRQKYIETLQPKVASPIRAIGVFSRPGSMGSMFLRKVSPAGAAIKSRAAKGKSGGLPQNVVVAVTDDQVCFFPFKPKGRGIKATDPLVVLDRRSVAATVTSESTLARRIQFQVAGEEPIELDSNQMPGYPSDFNSPILQVLGAPSG